MGYSTQINDRYGIGWAKGTYAAGAGEPARETLMPSEGERTPSGGIEVDLVCRWQSGSDEQERGQRWGVRKQRSKERGKYIE
jgi:hypothetical protein